MGVGLRAEFDGWLFAFGIIFDNLKDCKKSAKQKPAPV
jgi:hypothetical protein